MHLLILLPLVFEASSLAAGPEPYCNPLAQVAEKVSFCHQNEYYVQVADLCLKKFDNEVSAYQASLAQGFVRNGENSASAQHAKLGNSGANLGNTHAALSALLEKGKRARAELAAYGETMIYPGNPSAAFLARTQLAGHLATFVCYRENREFLNARIASLNGKLADLERTDKMAGSLNARTGAYQQNLNQSAGTGSVKRGTAAQARGAVKRPKAKASTISGEIKKEPARK